ncbi:MAG: hypothetical protein LAP87_13410 [Acidobacteriia bacterium]|nr:hypothetical protein [Terriglobia bacterium]
MNLTLRQQRYEELKRRDRGLVRRYLAKMTGLSRGITRLVTLYREEVKPKPYRRRRFPQRYSRKDGALRLQRRYGAGGLAPAPRPSEPGKGKLVTEKREGNPVLPFPLPLIANHPYVSERGLSPETAFRFEIGYHAGPGIMARRLAIPIRDEHGGWWPIAAARSAASRRDTGFPAGFRKSAAALQAIDHAHRTLA